MPHGKLCFRRRKDRAGTTKSQCPVPRAMCEHACLLALLGNFRCRCCVHACIWVGGFAHGIRCSADYRCAMCTLDTSVTYIPSMFVIAGRITDVLSFEGPSLDTLCTRDSFMGMFCIWILSLGVFFGENVHIKYISEYFQAM